MNRELPHLYQGIETPYSGLGNPIKGTARPVNPIEEEQLKKYRRKRYIALGGILAASAGIAALMSLDQRVQTGAIGPIKPLQKAVERLDIKYERLPNGDLLWRKQKYCSSFVPAPFLSDAIKKARGDIDENYRIFIEKVNEGRSGLWEIPEPCK